MSSPIETVLCRLDRVRQTSRGWIACCPAHEDRSPSLSISEGRDGRVLVHCFGGCKADEITRALGLELHELFPEKNNASRLLLRPMHRRKVPRRIVEQMLSTPGFEAFSEMAWKLASLDDEAMWKEILRSWDHLASCCDVFALIDFTRTIRHVAMAHFATAADFDARWSDALEYYVDAEGTRRAVDRLRRSVQSHPRKAIAA